MPHSISACNIVTKVIPLYQTSPSEELNFTVLALVFTKLLFKYIYSSCAMRCRQASSRINGMLKWANFEDNDSRRKLGLCEDACYNQYNGMTLSQICMESGRIFVQHDKIRQTSRDAPDLVTLPCYKPPVSQVRLISGPCVYVTCIENLLTSTFEISKGCLHKDVLLWWSAVC